MVTKWRTMDERPRERQAVWVYVEHSGSTIYGFDNMVMANYWEGVFFTQEQDVDGDMILWCPAHVPSCPTFGEIYNSKQNKEK